MARRRTRRLALAGGIEHHQKVARSSEQALDKAVGFANDAARKGECNRALRFLIAAYQREGVANSHRLELGKKDPIDRTTDAMLAFSRRCKVVLKRTHEK
jgi:hypothetical protein